MKVQVFSINTTAGARYGLANVKSGDVLYNATAKWKTANGAERYAAKMGYELMKQNGGTGNDSINL